MASGPNLLTGDSVGFEGGTLGGWNPYGNPIVANSTAQAHTGSHSMSVTSAAAGAYPVAINEFMPVLTSPSNFPFSCWVYPTVTGQDIYGQAQFYDVNSNLLFTNIAVPPLVVTQNTWNHYTCTFNAPINTYQVTLIVIIEGAAGAGTVAYFDDFSLVLSGSTPTFRNWRMNSLSSSGLPQQTVRERSLSVLASLVSGQNPDGTIKGS